MKQQTPPQTATPAATFTPIAPDANSPTFAELAADPEIAALLDFTPVPRKIQKANGWTADMQRLFIGWLAWHGSPGNACAELGKARSGIDKLYKDPDGNSFRAAWDGAIALWERRRIAHATARHAGLGSLRPPVPSRGAAAAQGQGGPLPGQMLNEHGDYEDADSLARRCEEAGESIARKLLRIRRMYLQEISRCPGKRAAFEILTELPIDWDKAGRGEAQADEPYNIANQRQPDMILTAESGWTWGDIGYGPNRKAQARMAIDQYREEEGLPPVNWEDEHQG